MQATISRLAAFFEHGDTEFAVFYPNHCLLSVFRDIQDADRAERELDRAGFRDGSVISVSGAEVILFAEDHLIKDGLWGILMTQLSRTFGTEALYADADLAAAREGAAFVVVRCPTQQVKSEVWRTLEPMHPIAARYYSFFGIEHMMSGNVLESLQIRSEAEASEAAWENEGGDIHSPAHMN